MSREEAGTPRTVRCPACGQKSVFEPWNPWRPFCCERCRKLDLGAWASESYRIPGKRADDDQSGGASGSEE